MASGYTVRLKEMTFLVYFEGPLLIDGATVTIYGVDALHLVDPKSRATLGVVRLQEPICYWCRPSQDVERALAEVESYLPGDREVIASLRLAHRMVRMGFTAARAPGRGEGADDERAIWVGDPEVTLVGAFLGVYSYAYRGLLAIDVANFRHYYDYQHRVDLVRSATIYVRMSESSSDAARATYEAALEALGPWRSFIQLTARPSGQGGVALELGGDLRRLRTADYLTKFVPRLARRLKEYVDSGPGQAVAAQA